MAEEDNWDQEIDSEQNFNDEDNAYMDDSRSDYEEGVNDFSISEVDWGEESWEREEKETSDAEYDQGDSNLEKDYEEEYHGEDSWQGDESQHRDYEGEETCLDESQTRSYHEENYGYEESTYGEGSEPEAPEGETAYGDKTNSEISYEEEDWREEEYQEETEFLSRREVERALQERVIEETWNEGEEPEFQYQDSEVHSIDDHPQDHETMSLLEEEDLTEKEDVVSEAGRDDCDPIYIYFSGHDQGPEAYLRWERDMDGWFKENSVPEDEKTFIAEETLVEEAYLQWDQDASFRLDYDLPDRTWGGMKQFMQQKFVEEPSTEPYHTRWKIPQEPRRWITVAPSKKSSAPEAMGLTKKMLQNAKESKRVLQIGKVKARAEQKHPAAPRQAYIVSRSKPFEEGEYDVEIKSLPTKEQWEDTKELTKTLKEVQPERTKDIGVLIGEYRPNQEDISYESTFSRNPTYHGVMEKKNRFKILSHKEDIQLTSWRISHEPKGDQHILIEAFRSYQDEQSCKITCSRKLTHQGITESWIHIKPGSDLEVIEVTSWHTGFRTSSAIGPDIELHSPTHSQSRPPTTWRMLMGFSWFQKAQETEKQPMEAQDVTQSPEHVRLVLYKVNYRLDRFSNNQTYVWRPGETLNQSGESSSILPYTSKHRIRRIPFPSHFPYLESSALKLQQLFHFQLVHDLDAFSTFKNVPRRHHFMPKLSRYKEPRAYLN